MDDSEFIGCDAIHHDVPSYLLMLLTVYKVRINCIHTDTNNIAFFFPEILLLFVTVFDIMTL